VIRGIPVFEPLSTLQARLTTPDNQLISLDKKLQNPLKNWGWKSLAYQWLADLF
jgi:hypothetical protein